MRKQRFNSVLCRREIRGNLLQRICCLLTDHKYRKGIAKSVGIEPTEYHYRCKICGKRFWNYTSFENSTGEQ